MVSVISFCLKTHPGFRVEMTPAFNGEFINNSLNDHSQNAHLSSISMPKTAQTTIPTTFRYVRSASSKISGNNFSPTSASTIADKSTVPISTIFDTTTQQNQPERMTTRYVHYNSHNRRPYVVPEVYDQPHEAFFYVELLCNLWFIIEFTTRFLVINLILSPFFPSNQRFYHLSGRHSVHCIPLSVPWIVTCRLFFMSHCVTQEPIEK